MAHVDTVQGHNMSLTIRFVGRSMMLVAGDDSIPMKMGFLRRRASGSNVREQAFACSRVIGRAMLLLVIGADEELTE